MSAERPGGQLGLQCNPQKIRPAANGWCWEVECTVCVSPCLSSNPAQRLSPTDVQVFISKINVCHLCLLKPQCVCHGSYCAHDGVPRGGEDISVVVALIMSF